MDKETVEKLIAEAIKNFKKSLTVFVLVNHCQNGKMEVGVIVKSNGVIIARDTDSDYIENWQPQ